MKVSMLLPNGGGNQVPGVVIVHAMAEYIDVDEETAAMFDVPIGEYHAYRWLEVCELSAHSLITPTGANLRAHDDSRIAWHAKNHNTDTLGIEFLVPGLYDYAAFLKKIQSDYLPDLAYHAGVDQVREWLAMHEIDLVTTHNEVDPKRKKDPGSGFPLQRFLSDIYV